jgi:AcrR family transcriptional regulator
MAVREPRRVVAGAAILPEGVTPSGTRGRILVAALLLFAETGFHGTSIRQIADRAGINSATMYSHYPSKEIVLAELIRIGHEELHVRLTEATSRRTAASEQLADLVAAHVLIHTDFPLLAVVCNQELHALSAEHAAPSLTLREKSTGLLLDVLNRGASSGEFSVPDVLLAGAAIAGMGMQVANWFGPDQPYTREYVAEQYVRFALRLVGADESTATPR